MATNDVQIEWGADEAKGRFVIRFDKPLTWCAFSKQSARLLIASIEKFIACVESGALPTPLDNGANNAPFSMDTHIDGADLRFTFSAPITWMSVDPSVAAIILSRLKSFVNNKKIRHLSVVSDEE